MNGELANPAGADSASASAVVTPPAGELRDDAAAPDILEGRGSGDEGAATGAEEDAGSPPGQAQGGGFDLASAAAPAQGGGSVPPAASGDEQQQECDNKKEDMAVALEQTEEVAPEADKDTGDGAKPPVCPLSSSGCLSPYGGPAPACNVFFIVFLYAPPGRAGLWRGSWLRWPQRRRRRSLWS